MDSGASTTASNRVLLVGEIHGTSETPEEFGRMVESMATRKEPLDVGVELPPSALNVACGAGAKAPGSDYWTLTRRDGRTSQAMWRLVCRLRDLERRRRISVFGLLPETASPPATGEHRYFAPVKARLDGSRQRLALLLGNFHARRRAGSLTSQIEASGTPVTAVTVSSPAAVAWNCRSRDSCGAQPISAQFCQSSFPSVRLLMGAAAGWGSAGEWDGCLHFPSLTASAPAAPEGAVAG